MLVTDLCILTYYIVRSYKVPTRTRLFVPHVDYYVYSVNLDFAIQPYPINFAQVPLSQTVLAGANISFNCSAAIVNEQTLPQFIWYHNNAEITNGNISCTGINMSTLFIYNVTEMDQGEYYCIVKDWETRTKSESGKLTGIFLIWNNMVIFSC